ncbi:MAG: 23S rRNA (uracil(1939)-C(5))-methyltransferase RlmD [Oscillospiraceae bacterium]|jgi:23S rRNA (uracil1939-C5)-methyltransferase|nr:23S rRNA (uracil(1939)-C(5))-methyltransferase RlmD [Oscillospiraceae bacterium]
MLKKNEIITLKIDSLTSEASGVGRHEGMAVFVHNAAPQELVEAKIIKTSKNYAIGKIEQVLEPSPHRIQPDCPLFGRCGGCDYRHISYSAELEAKEQRCRDALIRIGGITAEVLPIIAATEELRYRNKAQFPISARPEGGISMGFYARYSHRVIPCEDCLLQPKEFAAIAQAFKAWAEAASISAYDEATGRGVLRHLYLRKGTATGEVMACIVINAKNLPQSESLVEALRSSCHDIKSIQININRESGNVVLGNECRTLWGAGHINDVLCGVKLKLSPLSFYQVNRAQAERLYKTAQAFAGLTGAEVLLDLYCGIGSIGLSMAAQAKALIGVEIIPQAVENARENARTNGILNAEFICADAAQAAVQLKNRGITPDVIIADPPRKGCSAELLQTMAEMQPKRIVYVSCEPSTLARDLKLLSELGYAAQKIQPVDMFPRTKHVECVALLQK